MPLGLELAAAWLKRVNTARVAEEISRNFDFLETTAANVTERHRSLRAVFDYSWNLLTADETRILAATSVFKGGFTEDAAKAVCGATLNQLSSLIDKSLLRIDSSERYMIHEMIRQYAEEKLRDSGQAAAVRDAHALHYAKFVAARLSAIEGDGQLHAIDAIVGEMENIRQAWHRAIEREQFKLVDQMLEPLYYTYRIRSFGYDAWENFGMALDALQQQPESAERDILYARVLTRRTWFVYLAQLHGQDIVVNYGEAAALLRKHNALRDLSFTLCYFGVFHEDQNIGLASLYEALNIAKEIKSSDGQLLPLIFLSRRTTGAESREFNRQALAIARKIKNVEATSDCLRDLAQSMIQAGNYEEARKVINEALAGDRVLRDQLAIATDQNTYGLASAYLGLYSEAESAYREALPIARAIQFNVGVSIALRGLGFTALLAGAFETARNCYAEAAWVPMTHPLETQFVKLGFLMIELERGDYTATCQLADEIITGCAKLSNGQHCIANAREFLGFALYRQGHTEQAIAEFRQSIASHYKDERLNGVYHALTGLALALLAIGNGRDAAEITGFVSAQAGNKFVLTQRLLTELCGKLETSLSSVELGEAEVRGRTSSIQSIITRMVEQPA